MFQKYYHGGWAELRARTYEALSRCSEPESRQRAFAECCLRGRPEYKGDDESSATEWRIVTDRCHDRLCTVCAAARAWDIRLALYDQLKDKAHSFATLTLKTSPGEALKACIDRLYKAFRALRQSPLWVRCVVGGAAFMEVTRGKNGDHWHTHLHLILDATFMPKKELSWAWHAASEGSYIVDIERCGGSAAANYVTKYVTKAANGHILRTPELLDEFILAIKGRRTCTTFGDWYGKATLEDDTLDAERDATAGIWHGATVYTLAALETFLPPTPAGRALSDLPFFRWLRGQRSSTGPPPLP